MNDKIKEELREDIKEEVKFGGDDCYEAADNILKLIDKYYISKEEHYEQMIIACREETE